MSRRAVNKCSEVEVEVVCEPHRMGAECVVAAYDRVAPMARQSIDRHSTTMTTTGQRPRPQAGGAHG